jgi:ERCC4-type nuclease
MQEKVEKTKQRVGRKGKQPKSICLNQFNEYYYKEFINFSNEARDKNNPNMKVLYKKVALSISKYPFPILSASQAMNLEGVGESLSKVFENIINKHKTVLTSNDGNFIELAYKTNKANLDPNNNGSKRMLPSDTEAEINNLKSRKKLSNIEQYSSLWTTIISCYLLHLQQGGTLQITFKDISSMSNTLIDELIESIPKICNSDIPKDFKNMKENNLIDSLDNKSKFLKINEFLIKLAKLELKKSGILVENVDNELKFFMNIPSSVNSNNNLVFSQMSQYSYNKSEYTDNIKDNFSDSKKCTNFLSSKNAKSSQNNINNSSKVSNFISQLNPPVYREEEENINNVSTMTTSNKENSSSKEFCLSTSQSGSKLEENSLQNAFDDFISSKNSIIIDDNNKDENRIVLLVDNRERGPQGEHIPSEILNLSPNILIQERNLSLGDFAWIYIDPEYEKEYILDFIIERKILSDLASSIMDGRYTEQKYRLKNSNVGNLYYIFEGNMSTYQIANRTAISKQALTTAFYNTLNVHDINIYRSSSIEQTINFVLSIDTMIRSMNISKMNKQLFDEFSAKNAKTRFSTVESIFTRQLRCFDDCGAKSVDVLRKVFKTPKFIYCLLDNISCEETKENLINVASFLIESNLPLSEENLLHYSSPHNFKSIKKQIKSVKKIRKNTNSSIINFYN